MSRRWLIATVVGVGILFPAATASAHARFLGSDPKIEAQLKNAPETVTIDFSEPPVSARQVVIEDGCGDDVITRAEVDDKQIVAELGEGQPGRWTVSFRVISAVDDHRTKDEFAFMVAGKRDCRRAAAPPPREESDQGSGLPILLAVGVTTVLLTGAAVVIRKRSS